MQFSSARTKRKNNNSERERERKEKQNFFFYSIYKQQIATLSPVAVDPIQTTTLNSALQYSTDCKLFRFFIHIFCSVVVTIIKIHEMSEKALGL